MVEELRYKTFGRNRSLRLPGLNYSGPFVFLITIVTLGRSNVFVVPTYADAVVNCLKTCRQRYGYLVHAYCLMPNHLHLLLTPGNSGVGLSRFVGAFKSLSTRAYWASGGSGRLWQSHYHDHVLRSEERIVEVADYVLNNPVRNGLAASHGEYRYAGMLDDVPA